ncbi:MAG: DUF4271 domain-containing protein [Crocinitomicaceae bacterium]|nr:DUF4271 domain-containing protein [Crocinitomicaceae bacterium]
MIEQLSLLSVGVGVPIESNHEIYFWVLMGLNLIFIAIAKTLNQDYISVLFNTAIINRQLLQKTQDELKLGSASSVLLTLTYFSNLSIILAYTASGTYGKTALIIAGVLIGSVLIKWLAMWFVAFVSEFRGGISEHGMNHLIYYQVGGILLTPILFLSHFFSENIYSKIILGCLIISGLLILLREIQSLGRAIKSRISPLYIILYLCTLELMPFVLVIYAFVNNYAGLN